MFMNYKKCWVFSHLSITKKKNLQNSEKLKFEPPASWSKPKEMKKIRFWSSKDVEFFMSKLELDRVNFQVN